MGRPLAPGPPKVGGMLGFFKDPRRVMGLPVDMGALAPEGMGVGWLKLC